MPAVNFDMVLNESFKKDMWELVEVATLIIGLIPVLKVGVSALVKTISAIDVAIMAAAIIVDRNKDSLPGWFRESFGYIETASIGLILVGNPRHLLKAEQQLAKLDGHIANLSKAQRAIPGLENALFALKETLEGQINFGKRVAKSDESTLRKLITEVSESTMDGAKKRELLEALNEQLRTVTKKAVSVLDEAAYRQKQISDALINQGQEAVNITKKADMTAPVITKTEKTGEAILDGNSIILKSADGADIARPLFRSTDEALAWLEYSKKSRFSDARHIDELEPKMHPWFFDESGKKLLPESHPHLYDGERPLSLEELFGKEGKLKQKQFDELTNNSNVLSPEKKGINENIENLSAMSEKEAEEIFSELNKNSPNKLTPNTREHKAQRWHEYKERKGSEAWSYERWSKQYDANMKNYTFGTGREAEYRLHYGGKKELYKTPFTYRDLDSVNHETKEIFEIKTGKEYLTTEGDLPNTDRILKDSWFVDQGYKVTWILEEGGSAPLLEALKEAGIEVLIGRQIP
ncbi:hypothetical protein GCM10009118_21250 [Wandonia haliotis]|uniref:Uncharacterized protein n=2 Tax=Wandonia haliotis TaxID=574963 RepID=A0ABP3Y2G6_9FLAO